VGGKVVSVELIKKIIPTSSGLMQEPLGR